MPKPQEKPHEPTEEEKALVGDPEDTLGLKPEHKKQHIAAVKKALGEFPGAPHSSIDLVDITQSPKALQQLAIDSGIGISEDEVAKIVDYLRKRDEA